MTAADLRPGRIDATVVIPLRWPGTEETYRVEEMARYLDGLRHTVAAVVVVDGSAPSVRREHERAPRCWGWSADVLVENLELWRTVEAGGVRAVRRSDVMVVAAHSAEELRRRFSRC